MLPKVKYFLEYYAKSGYSDDRAIADFVTCENDETLNMFRAEVYGITQGSYQNDLLLQFLGKNRELKHQSFVGWGKYALMVLAEKRR